MIPRKWHEMFTNEELATYGSFFDDWVGNKSTSSIVEELSRWVGDNVRLNPDGSLSIQYSGDTTGSKPAEQELKAGDMKPLDDFLETFSIKE